MRRKRNKTVDWRLLDGRRAKSRAIRGQMKLLRQKRIQPTSNALASHFSGVTRMGIVTHCWRYGPRLPNALVRR